MIKMDYGDAAHQKVLENRFASLLDDEANRQKVWVKLRTDLYKRDGHFKKLLPTQLKELMVKPFMELAVIYEHYIALGLAKDNELHLRLKALFSYEKAKGSPFKALSEDFIGFFKEEKNGFKIHSCHYCDMAYINYFKYANGKRTQFDLDHVLDKGRCPLVALSLYNLVPACPTCNGPHIKGQRAMEVSQEQRQKLSPSSPLYDFDNKVKIWIRPITGKISNTNMLSNQSKYELDFDTSADTDYEKEISLFYLRERYNYHKCEALRLADLKAKYSQSKIVEMAKLICSEDGNKEMKMSPEAYRTIEQIKTDLFGSEFSQNYHRAFGKLHKDILGK